MILLAGVSAAVAQTQSARGGHLAVSARPTAVVLDRVTVINVESGERQYDRRVVIVGNRIRAVRRHGSFPPPPGARLVDARGKYLIPGLWDMHVHPGWDGPVTALTYPRADVLYHELLANGITGVRDPGNAIPLDTLRAWKRTLAAGRRIGPRMIVSGPSINNFRRSRECERDSLGRCRPSFSLELSRPEEADFVVDSLKAAGADMIKIREMPRRLWLAVSAAARRAGIPFGGHFNLDFPGDTLLPRTVDGLVASDSGARILDHSLWADVCGAGRDTVESLAQCAAAAARLRRNHTWVAFGDDPIAEDLEAAAQPPGSFRARAMRYTPPKHQEFFSDPGPWQPPSAAERRQLPTGADFAATWPDSMRHGGSCRRFLLAYAANIPWLPGPDLPVSLYVPGVHLALLRRVLCGVPPLWVLQGATLNPVRALGLTDSLGTVATGKVADLVLLDGDPLEDIWNVTKIAAVVANGRYFDRAALDRLLVEADARWRQAIAKQRVTSPP